MKELLERYPCLDECSESIEKALELIIDTYKTAVKYWYVGMVEVQRTANI